MYYSTKAGWLSVMIKSTTLLRVALTVMYILFETATYFNAPILLHNAMLARPMLSLCVRLSGISWHSTKPVNCIQMIFGMEASFDLSYTVLKEILVTPKIRVLPFGTLCQSLDFKNFTIASRSLLGIVSKAYRWTTLQHYWLHLRWLMHCGPWLYRWWCYTFTTHSWLYVRWL